MKREFKKKVASVTIAVGILTATGTIFANTDAGAHLSSWYKESLQKQTDTMVSASIEDMNISIRSFKGFVSNTKEDVSSLVNEFNEKIIFETESDIKNHQIHYQNQLKETKKNLQSVNFDQYSKEVQKREEQAIVDETEAILADVLGN
ncbi:hypothetical protein [Bacillus suaedaesalsae]|uniref:Uncharacterized protein n=1 Tax=Bacillus suaedaesalsae TaxID=2810349 RepID=A0ABS2DNL3_9BACI|nr:hypothetical protein [Bacillus suaedaesalsae]MBM6619138.1 hypothetical protein [Bacillus suaedaesalsae]